MPQLRNSLQPQLDWMSVWSGDLQMPVTETPWLLWDSIREMGRDFLSKITKSAMKMLASLLETGTRLLPATSMSTLSTGGSGGLSDDPLHVGTLQSHLCT